MFLSFGTLKNLDTKSIYYCIEKLNYKDKSGNYTCLQKCHGYYLDKYFSGVISKPHFLSDILAKFLAVFVEKNFEFKEKYKDKKNKSFYKEKTIRFIEKKINENPILDIALVVFMRSKIVEGFDDTKKKNIRADIFGNDLNPNLIGDICQNIDGNVDFFNFDAERPCLIHLNKNKESKDNFSDYGIYIMNGNYGIVFNQEKAKLICGWGK